MTAPPASALSPSKRSRKEEIIDSLAFESCSVVRQSMLKSLHRQGAKNAKANLPVTLFSVISVLSVAPW